eukprot:Rhum_TRINITY_DN7330_c0_g1::Rhum_TRINITY_DN7330_c0_g1_i1::g.22438::m.22438
MSAEDKEDAIHGIFQIADADRDGQVSLSELRAIFQTIRKYDVLKRKDTFDMTGALSTDDTLNYEEFKANILPMLEALGLSLEHCLVKLQSHWLPQELADLRELFEVVDIDGGDSITKDELRDMMGTLKPGLTDQDLLTAMKMADQDGGGDIDFDEFCEFVTEIKLELPLPESVDLLRKSYAEKSERLERTKNMFTNQEETAPAAKLTPAEAARLQRAKRKQEKTEGDSIQQMEDLEGEERRVIEVEEAEAWLALSSQAYKTLNNLATEERMERERERERRRRDFSTGGAQQQREQYAGMKARRETEEQQRKAKRTSKQRFNLEDRLEQQESSSLCYGQQFKILRQMLNRGIDHVRLEAEREFGDIHRTLPRHNEEISGSIGRIEDMLATVGRALMSESMSFHGSDHKAVLQDFEGDRDFTWLRGNAQVDKETYLKQLKQHRVSQEKKTATYVNFTDPSNLSGEARPPTLALTAKQVKKYLFATYKHYLSSGTRLTFSDFQKLVADCKVDVAGSLVVLWNKALNDEVECDLLGLRKTDNTTRDSAGGRVDFHQFSNLMVLLACERYIAAPATSAEYKLECFLLHEVLPLLPHEVLLQIGSAADTMDSPLTLVNDTHLPTIPILLEDHFDALVSMQDCIRKQLVAYIDRRGLTARAKMEEDRRLAEGLLTPEQLLGSMGLMAVREQKLPVLKLSPEAQQCVRALQGHRGHPVIALKEVLNFLAYRAPAVGRQAIKDALLRALSETLASTYPTVPSVRFDVESSKEPIPFPMFLALAVKVATYTSIAAAVPVPPPPPQELTPSAYQVYAFLRLLTHTGHYVLNL